MKEGVYRAGQDRAGWSRAKQGRVWQGRAGQELELKIFSAIELNFPKLEKWGEKGKKIICCTYIYYMPSVCKVLWISKFALSKVNKHFKLLSFKIYSWQTILIIQSNLLNFVFLSVCPSKLLNKKEKNYINKYFI
jgi:hypothetical protein